MGNISTYVSGHTELTDVSEFFQKQLLSPGERPIAFFDGVFYESHQERVGNIVYQDYLIYSDRAVYLWARGATKDFLDRFPLGAVTINSRNKDSDFATLNLRIRRESKEPVYVIFDMVEIDEAEKISTLHTIIESTIENYLGSNFRDEIPDDVASSIYSTAQATCPPRSIALGGPSAGEGSVPGPDSNIGYGQDLLEQYKASIGYPPGAGARPGAASSQGAAAGGYAGSNAAQEAMKNLEGVLPTDPESLKRVAANLKGMIGDAPFKFRDQVMKDLQHIPNDVATVLTAVNELISNISDNPQAEKFVMNAIQTAVKNDGIIGSFGKLLKLSSSFGPMGKKPQSSGGGSSSGKEDSGSFGGSGDDTVIRRKKIKIQTEGQPSSGPDNDDILKDAVGNMDLPSGVDDDAVVQRKRIRVKIDDSVRSPLTTGPDPEPRKEDISGEQPHEHQSPSVRSRKIGIKAEEPEPEILIDEDLLAGALKDAEEDTSADLAAREKTAREAGVIDTTASKNPAEKAGPPEDIYKTLESEPQHGASLEKGHPKPGGIKPADTDEPVKKQEIKVKSSQ